MNNQLFDLVGSWKRFSFMLSLFVSNLAQYSASRPTLLAINIFFTCLHLSKIQEMLTVIKSTKMS